MRQISEYIVKLFEKRGVICASAEEREVYIYGFDIAIYTFLSTLGLFFLSLIHILRKMELFVISQKK